MSDTDSDDQDEGEEESSDITEETEQESSIEVLPTSTPTTVVRKSFPYNLNTYASFFKEVKVCHISFECL